MKHNRCVRCGKPILGTEYAEDDGWCCEPCAFPEDEKECSEINATNIPKSKKRTSQ